MEAGFSQIRSHTIATTRNPQLCHSTYFPTSLYESAVNPEEFGPSQSNLTDFFVYNILCRSRDLT